jgi:hypothetical protein
MQCLPKNPATRRYTLRIVPAMILYFAAVFGVVELFQRFHPTGTAAYLLAVLPALPILAMIASIGLYLSEVKDEFQRNLFIQAMVWGIGLTLCVTTVWGCLEQFTNSAHLSLFWIFPMYWFFVALATAALQVRYR